MAKLDPLSATERIVNRYLSYVETTFSFSDVNLQKQLKEELRGVGRFSKGPILEATPPFESSNSIDDMIEERVLSNEFKKLCTQELPLERNLYLHQKNAIYKLVKDRRNLIIATGTGSGKTETFLIPILNHLFREKENGKLGPGVRALLLYPMNALANDQLKRMRRLLKNYPSITFGSYTGETEKEEKQAIEQFKKMNPKEDLLPNELLSRKRMQDTPPHILLTNYAMLEYLLLRPEDNVFFDGDYAKNWRFIVIDEIHIYSGAKGIELAMLLRRLKDRVVKSRHGVLQCIGTSATLVGEKEDDYKDVTEFAERLFGEKFEWIKGDSRRQDVVTGNKKRLVISQESWNKSDVSLYNKWVEIVEGKDVNKIERLIEEGLKAGIPIDVLEKARKNSDGDWRKFIYIVLSGDSRLIALQNMLEKEPQYLSKAANVLFEDESDKQQLLVSLVHLANNAKMGVNEQPLLPARYHLFIRALEGGFISLFPKKRLYLERREWVEDEKGCKYRVFEIATCSQCSSVYLVGEIDRKNDIKFLKQPGNRYFEDSNNLEYFLLVGNKELVPENEDEIVSSGEDVNFLEKEYVLCGKCGAIKDINEISDFCSCGEEYKVCVIKSDSKNGALHKCPACGTMNTIGSVARRFVIGNEAATSVLSTALYQEIPDKIEDVINDDIDNDSGWNVQISEEAKTESNRRMLIFSDSRQDAAFFSTYLQTSYNQILQRRLIIMTLEKYKDKVIKNEWRVEDLAEYLKKLMNDLKLFDLSQQQLEEEAWKWVLYEFMDRGGSTSLESLGLLGFVPVMPSDINFGRALKSDPWNLTEDEIKRIMMILLDSMRKNGAICFPDSVSPKDQFFAPLNKEFYFKENYAIPGYIYSWNPVSKGRNNTRLDFLMRLFKAKGKNISRKEIEEFLENVWNKLLLGNKSPWNKYISSHYERNNIGQVFRLNLDYWKLVPSIVDESIKWYRCTKCNRLSLHNVLGVCPTYRCDGRLVECDPKDIFRDNHYRKLYTDILPLTLKASEHTAQLTTETAAEIQKKFENGEINVLSSSTTFELGVDVGDLETVFMRNVPPTPANYVQRAGRAGRRTSTTAFVLTFAQRRSHDFTYYSDPLNIVNGKVQTPHIEIKNEKIIKRHVYAVALAMFWRLNPNCFGEVKKFFIEDDRPITTIIEDFLIKRPMELKESLMRIVPDDLHDVLGIDDWSWMYGLLDEKEGVLKKAEANLLNDLRELRNFEEECVNDKNYSKASAIQRTINTLERRYIINYLSQNNVIPKYGFPVDVVELKVDHHGDEAKGLELTRDLKIALSEYAPESQIVAGGKLWTSKYIKKLPDRDPIKYNYAICDYCGHYYSNIADVEKDFDTCSVCGHKIGNNRGVFITPEFGFIAGEPQKPTLVKPERTYSTRKYFAKEGKIEREHEYEIGGFHINIQAGDGKLAVINSAGKRGFKVCETCGYSEINTGNPLKIHKTPMGKSCKGKLSRYSLGYEFKTDILSLKIVGYSNEREGFWESLLYGLIEGACRELEIERQDIDGTLYTYSKDPYSPAIVLFDDVPGGAGQVKRIADKENFIRVLNRTLDVVSSCECGGERADTSCYGCLRNYTNQYCHDKLKRIYVIDFINNLLNQHK
ncbi:DEAD/DEAH box helicase [Thermoanaerobacterium sp. RBIITD]|uniref:DEAD/DEAH box helicase n=1 Tax=Thermoanaerobacterium sp. RBIITD TaxID=1550240 RepID=UPI000BB9A32A|nr:DEAD/DEAH box helicase [Thermoanaerobacterium sp. RBIITD]SNX52879.1 Helicase conserved C-terminal domain-containing protein [Thermoanaerobacterium sp. RBIITD]